MYIVLLTFIADCILLDLFYTIFSTIKLSHFNVQVLSIHIMYIYILLNILSVLLTVIMPLSYIFPILRY